MLLNMGLEFHDGFQGPEDHHFFLPELVGEVGPHFGLFQTWGYPNSWMVYHGKKTIFMMEKPMKHGFFDGTSHIKMDDLGILVDLSIMLLKKTTYNWRTSFFVLIGAVPHPAFFNHGVDRPIVS